MPSVLAAVLLYACLTTASAERALHAVTTTSQSVQTTVPYNVQAARGSQPIPLTDPRLAPTQQPAEQVQLLREIRAFVTAKEARACIVYR